MLCDFPARSIYRQSPEREPPEKQLRHCAF